MKMVAKNASIEKIELGIPESELRTFIEHTRNTLDALSTDRNWLRSGEMSLCHDQLMPTVGCWSEHLSFVEIFLSYEGMEAVAKFYASRKKNNTPNHKVAQLIAILVNNFLGFRLHEGLPPEKVFGIIEKTGLLGRFIRCVPVDPEFSSYMVTCLQTCLQLVESGTRTGDILDALIAGKDGPISETVKSSLVRLQNLARLSNNKNDNKIGFLNVGHYCEKMATQMDNALLMKCQRCKEINYCSKDCQKADWKIHKKTCKEPGSSVVSLSTLQASHTTMLSFVRSNYFDIAKEVHRQIQEYNVPKKELLLELDFYEDAPALRHEFKVWLTSDFFEGSSVVDAPGWFRADADKKAMAHNT